MSQTTLKQLEELAALSALQIPEERRESLCKEMDAVLAFVETLQAVPVGEGDDWRPWLPAKDAREDVVVPCPDDERALILQNFSAASKDGLLAAQGALPTADL